MKKKTLHLMSDKLSKMMSDYYIHFNQKKWTLPDNR